MALALKRKKTRKCLNLR